MDETAKTEIPIKNARIVSTHLGPSHGTAFTFSLELDNGHGTRNVGNLDMGRYNKRKERYEGWSGAVPMIIAILQVVGVDSWEDLPGKHIRYKESSGGVYAIGHIIKDNWLEFGEFACKYSGDFRRALKLRNELVKVSNIDPRIVKIIETMGTPDLTAEKIWNPTCERLGEKVFSLLNEGCNVFIDKGNDAFAIVIRPFRKEEKCQK